LPDNDEDALYRVGVFGSEGGGDAGISEFDLIVHKASSAFLGPFSHALLGHVVHHLNLFGDPHPDVVFEVVEPLLKLSLFLLLLFFLLHHFADVGRSNDSYSYIRVSESSDIVGPVSSVDDPSLLLFEVFYDHFLVVGGGSGKDTDEGVVVMGDIFGG
jgi:hypothetical protein